MRNERYRKIVETASEGIWTIDEKNLTTLANRALAEMLGYEPQEMLGKSVFDFMAPAFVEEAQRSLRLRREGVNEQLEFPFRAKDGHEVWTLMATSSLHDRDGEYVGALAMVTDITTQKAAEVERIHLSSLELQYMAEHDWLTDLHNRRSLTPELDACLGYAARYGHTGAVLVLDVDHFKFVNDSGGHDAGDRTLRSVAEVLVSRTRATDIVARLGGDEFAIVLFPASGFIVSGCLPSFSCSGPSFGFSVLGEPSSVVEPPSLVVEPMMPGPCMM